MEQACKKRSHEATANSPPVLPDMGGGKLLYKSGKFGISVSFLYIIHLQSIHLYFYTFN